MKARLAGALLLVLAACGRNDRPEATSSPAPSQAPSVGAWTWHPLGGLAVVEGEVTGPTELILEGRSIREIRFAEPGPVRWEFFRPPAGEVAVLRTAEGRELARFEFSLPPARPRPAPSSPRPARRPEPPRAARPAPAPVPEPSAPKTRAETPSRNRPVPPLPGRKAPALASVSAARTDEAPGRASTAAPIPPGPVLPRPAEPLPPTAAAGPAPAWPGMGEALNLTRGPGGHKRLLLSFDGGSSAEVAAEVLDLLKARGIRTTLFLTGAFIQRFPALVKRMAAEGHELGNHTMNHPHFAPDMKRDPRWTRERVQRELLDADAALLRLLGRPMDPFWRAPYGEHTAEIRRWAEELGYRHVGWSEGADTLDWATPRDRRLYRSGEAIVSRLQRRLGRDGDGLIVLMHLGSERALGDRPTDGLGAFMDRARTEGWTFVSAGTFMRGLGKPAWDSHQRLALLHGAHLDR
ncbi:MAG: polysaccharide deacetylase family protein [Geothrix sp.]|nr:polysaccharide deacetylase family protein [Geothrix sp.]